MQVSKRDGRRVLFNRQNIKDAVLNAFIEVDGEESQYAKDKARDIANYIESLEKDLSVEEIQNIVEEKLMGSNRKDVAKAYILYRNNRSKERDKNSLLYKNITKKLFATNVENQNANVDERSFGGRMGAVNSEVMKNYALNYIMSPTVRDNHIYNRSYTHDLDQYAVGNHNCLSVPFDKLLANGFNTRHTDVRPANSINTAFQLVAVIFQLQSLQQFGGVSATHLDWTMVPYVRKSFYKHYKDYIELVEEKELDYSFHNGLSIDENDYKVYNPKAYKYAMKKTEKECSQAVEGMYHNLNTLQSRSGNQLPFTSINYGTCTLPEGRLVIKALLEGSIKGVGKFHKTSIFPCGIWQCMKGVNRKPGEPNYDLFQLALRSTSQRLYPNYCNCDWSGNEGYDPNDPKTYFSTIDILVA